MSALTPQWIDCRDGLIVVRPDPQGGYYKRDEVDAHDAALRQQLEDAIDHAAGLSSDLTGMGQRVLELTDDERSRTEDWQLSERLLHETKQQLAAMTDIQRDTEAQMVHERETKNSIIVDLSARVQKLEAINFDHETGFHAAKTEIERLTAKSEGLERQLNENLLVTGLKESKRQRVQLEQAMASIYDVADEFKNSTGEHLFGYAVIVEIIESKTPVKNIIADLQAKLDRSLEEEIELGRDSKHLQQQLAEAQARIKELEAHVIQK